MEDPRFCKLIQIQSNLQDQSNPIEKTSISIVAMKIGIEIGNAF